jgi:hypothetical protein
LRERKEEADAPSGRWWLRIASEELRKEGDEVVWIIFLQTRLVDVTSGIGRRGI